MRKMIVCFIVTALVLVAIRDTAVYPQSISATANIGGQQTQTMTETNTGSVFIASASLTSGFPTVGDWRATLRGENAVLLQNSMYYFYHEDSSTPNYSGPMVSGGSSSPSYFIHEQFTSWYQNYSSITTTITN
ncbi:MAG TPA: hypothetical protein DEO62_01850 [Lachnospiraceae bacterium]|jgi:hypothetical protein|nr:hypothetical protein [Lachnospiraceae bacterium]HBZ89749.1 hypothetical protein [Lachnospiraceae bacterium]